MGVAGTGDAAAIDLHVSLLGPIEVTAAGERLLLAGQKRLAVLAVLSLRAGRVVSSDALIGCLWGLDPPSRAANTLQSHVSHVRRALGPASSLVVSRPPGYVLDLPAGRVDVHRFDALAAAGRASLAAGRPGEAAEQLAAALDLWRGPALDDLAGLEFAEREALRLEEGRLAAIEDHVDAELALGRHRQLVAGLGELVVAHPLRERLAGQLMLALYRCDRQAESLQVYQDTRRRLIEDLGIEPSRSLQALEEAVLLQKPELDLPEGCPSGTGSPPPSAAAVGAESGGPRAPGTLPRAVERIRDRARLVGRDELVASVVQLVRDEHPPFVLVTGEPGIGKSRLAAEVADRAAASGSLVLYGRCDPEGGAPYHPVADALADLAERDPSIEVDLGPGPHSRGSRADAETAGDETGPAARDRAFDRVASAVEAASAGRGVLVLVDDLHWADRATVALLRHLVVGRWAGRFAVVATCRSTGDRPPWLASLLEQAAADEVLAPVELDALPVAAVAELATSLGLGEEADALHTATGGNPLLIRQLSHSTLSPSDGERRWSSLALVLEARVRDLSGGARTLLEVAALAGSRFELRVVADAAGVAGADALDLLDEANRARLVDEVEGPATFAFVHDVVREHLVERVPMARRLRLHAALGAALERASGEASAIAHHYLAAAPVLGDAVVAERVADAADRARRRLAYEDAAALYRSASEVLRGDRHAGDERWEQIMLRMAGVLFDAGDAPAARAAVLEVADAARRRGDATRLAEAAIAYQGRWIPTRVGLDDDHRALLVDARSLLADDGPPALRARLDARLALAAFHGGGDDGSCTARSAAAVHQARGSGDPRALAEAITARHTTAMLDLSPGQRLELCAELRDAALKSGDAETVANSHAEAAVDRLAAGDVSGARAELARFDAHAAATGSATLRWRQAVLAATFALADGRFDDADASATRGLELGIELNQDDAEFAWAAQTFVSTWCRQGAGPVTAAAAELAARHPETPAWVAAHALGLADTGRNEDAVALLRPLAAESFAGVPRDLLWLSVTVTAAEAVISCRDEPTAPLLIELLEPYTGSLAVVGAGVAVLGPVDRVLGLLHALARRPADAQRHLSCAHDVLGPDELPPFRAMTLLARAEVAATAGGDRARVEVDAAEARRLATSLGMPALAARAAALTGPTRRS